jgi:hypothetical protein
VVTGVGSAPYAVEWPARRRRSGVRDAAGMEELTGDQAARVLDAAEAARPAHGDRGRPRRVVAWGEPLPRHDGQPAVLTLIKGGNW